MKKIYKYPFSLENRFYIELPVDSVILNVQSQHNIPCIWAEVNLNKPIEERHFAVYSTGGVLPNDSNDNHHYIGTFMLNQGDLMFHLYEVDRIDE